MNDQLPDAERIKRESRQLRGTLIESLADEATGALADDDTKISKFHGIYQQDDRDLRDERRRQKLEPHYQYMVRLRLPGGVLSPTQWLELDRIAGECANGTLRLTSRQTFQFHGVFKGQLRPLLQATHALGIDSRGACGDVNRNVVTNVNPHESALHGQVHDLATRISERLCWRSRAYEEIWLEEASPPASEDGEEPFYGEAYLPRKFKIALAVPPENDCDVFANDIGLIAIVEEGQLTGFDVAVGGGMGVTYGEPGTYPRLASLLGFIPADQVVDACETIAAIQRDHGMRTNRNHARLKYTLDDHGLEWFREQFSCYHGQPLQKPRPFSLSHNGDRFGWVEGEDGYQHLTLYIEGGRVADFENNPLRTALRELAMVHKGEFRITCNQNLMLANVPPEEKARIQHLVEEFGLDDGRRSSPLRRDSMACVAFPTCGLAMAESERYLPTLLDRLEALLERTGLGGEAIKVRITGCPNGCARPYLGEIGLTGKAPGKYNLYLGADRIGRRLNQLYRENIDEDTILQTLEPLLRHYAQGRQQGEAFGDYLVRTGVVSDQVSAASFHEPLGE